METKKRRRGVLPILLVLIVLIIGALLYDSNTRIVATEYVLQYPDMPKPFDGFRIAVLSDIHAAEFGEKNSKLISMIADAAPDIIVIAGDIIDHDKKPPIKEQLEIAGSLVERLSPVASIYYITGNHEWGSGGIKELFTMLAEYEVCVLRNRYILLEAGSESIILAGIDDPNGPADMKKPDDFIREMYEAEGRLFTILLEHRNNHLSLHSAHGVDLVLSGHAHGGIIRIPFTDGLIGQSREWMPKYTSGVNTMGGTNMVVSRGIGNHTGLPRFLNNPEVVIVELRLEETA